MERNQNEEKRVTASALEKRSLKVLIEEYHTAEDIHYVEKEEKSLNKFDYNGGVAQLPFYRQVRTVKRHDSEGRNKI